MVFALSDGLEPAGLVREGGAGASDLVSERFPEVVVPVEAEDSGHADQGVGLDPGLGGQLSHGQHGHVAGIVQHVLGRLLDLRGQVGVGLSEAVDHRGRRGRGH